MELPQFTCEVLMPDDPDGIWRKFSFLTEDRRRRFMDRARDQGGDARPATLERKDLPPVLQAMLAGE
jgi:hypothetical protein